MSITTLFKYHFMPVYKCSVYGNLTGTLRFFIIVFAKDMSFHRRYRVAATFVLFVGLKFFAAGFNGFRPSGALAPSLAPGARKAG